MFGLVRHTPALARRSAAWPQRLDPWSEMDRIRHELDDFVTRAFGLTPLGQMLESGSDAAMPPIEVRETSDRYTLRAYLPGIAREDVHLEALADRILLWGKHRTETPAEGCRVLLNTARMGRFRFEYALPAEIRPEQVTATCRDGVLEVTLPKAEVERPASVKVPIEG